MIRTTLRLLAAALVAAGFSGVATAQAPRAAQAPAATAQPAQGGQVQSGDLAKVGELSELPGPIDSPRDVRDTLKMAFVLADTDHDGQISKKEATDVGLGIVGGMFFRADANGDGTVTKEEAQQVRQEVLQRQPILRVLVQEARQQREQSQQGGTNPISGLANLLDENNDQQLQANEVRQAVSTGVDAFYAAADTNRDGQMSPAEMNAAAIGLARAAGQAAFRLADDDNNGSVSQAEFEKALVEPARVVFSAADADNDGQISAQEARQAQKMLMSRMQINVPDASGTNAPIPNFGSALPNAGNPPRGGAQPVQPVQPR